MSAGDWAVAWRLWPTFAVFIYYRYSTRIPVLLGRMYVRAHITYTHAHLELFLASLPSLAFYLH